MKKYHCAGLLLAAVLALGACSTESSASSGSVSSTSSGESSSLQNSGTDSGENQSVNESKTAAASERKSSAEDDEKNGPGKRVRVTLDQAVLKKNQDEQFVLLYIKDDCEYCARFDEVLNPYLQSHPLTVYEVDLSQAEQMYLDEDREAMLNILTAGVNRTPALYYIESQEKVNLLDHTEDNYSESGLSQWVEKYDLERL